METGKALEIVHTLAAAQLDGLSGFPEEMMRHLKESLDTVEDFIVNNFGEESTEDFEVKARVSFEYDFTEMVGLLKDEDEEMTESWVHDVVVEELVDLHPEANLGHMDIRVLNLPKNTKEPLDEQ